MFYQDPEVCNRDLKMLIFMYFEITLVDATIAPASMTYVYGSLVMRFGQGALECFFTFAFASIIKQGL
jgi:hypothetical protein